MPSGIMGIAGHDSPAFGGSWLAIITSQESNQEMPRTPKATDGEAPKKRTRKTAVAGGDGTKVTKTSRETSELEAAKSAEVVAVRMPQIEDVVALPSLEERIRFRAYELYLRRNGVNGSPEQDWFQAVSEIYSESVA